MNNIVKAFLLVAVTTFLFFSCKENESSKASILVNGEVKDFPDGMMTLYRVFDEDSSIIDTTSIKGGKFSFKINDDESRLASLVFPDGMSAIQFFTEPGIITVTDTKDDIQNLSVTGTETNGLNAELKKSNSNVEEKYAALMQVGSAANEAGDVQAVDSITSLLMNLEKETNQQNIEFAKKHPTSVLSAYLGLMAASSGADLDLNGLYNMMTPAVQQTFFGTRLKTLVDASLKTAIGASAPEFEGMTPEGKLLKLSSLKGKILLVDFWASWCGPCRQENPNVVKAYAEYNPKGFDILGVSLDQEKDKWLEAISQDGLNWPHVSDLMGWKSKIAGMYGVQGIPQNFLLDKEGKVVAKGLRGQALIAKLDELLN